jgi:SAM-dependent methyltransferase
MDGFDLDAWCGGVPGLHKVQGGFWELPEQPGVSFPAGGHASLADVEPNSYWFKHRNDIIAAAAKRFPPKGTIFDIGGGNGYVGLGLRAAGFDCVVMEPGPVGAANAVTRGFATIRAPFQELRISSGSIPSIGIFDVLEHIPDDAAALAAFHAALVPGGRLYIAVPAHSLLWSDEDVYAGHYRRYTLARLRGLLHQSDFSLEYGTYFFTALIAPIFLLRTLPALLRRSGPARLGDASQDHSLPSGIVGAVLRASFARELARVRAGECISFGASCLVVGRKH